MPLCCCWTGVDWGWAASGAAAWPPPPKSMLDRPWPIVEQTATDPAVAAIWASIPGCCVPDCGAELAWGTFAGGAGGALEPNADGAAAVLALRDCTGADLGADARGRDWRCRELFSISWEYTRHFGGRTAIVARLVVVVRNRAYPTGRAFGKFLGKDDSALSGRQNKVWRYTNFRCVTDVSMDWITVASKCVYKILPSF